MIARVVYGLEVQKLSRTDVESLEKFRENVYGKSKGFQLKLQIVLLSLSLLGIPPFELIIHKNILNLFHSM